VKWGGPFGKEEKWFTTSGGKKRIFEEKKKEGKGLSHKRGGKGPVNP